VCDSTSHNGRVPEVSCVNCTLTVVAAKKYLSKSFYLQRDSGAFGPHLKFVYGLHNGFCDSNGINEDENTIVLSLIILSYVKSMKT